MEVGVDLYCACQAVFSVGLDALSKGLDGVAEGLVAAVLVKKFEWFWKGLVKGEVSSLCFPGLFLEAQKFAGLSRDVRSKVSRNAEISELLLSLLPVDLCNKLFAVAIEFLVFSEDYFFEGFLEVGEGPILVHIPLETGTLSILE